VAAQGVQGWQGNQGVSPLGLLGSYGKSGTVIGSGSNTFLVNASPSSNILIASTSFTQTASYLWVTGYGWSNADYVTYRPSDVYVTMTSANNWTITGNLYSTDFWPGGGILSYTFFYSYI
jgi:hypothetical protein